MPHPPAYSLFARFLDDPARYWGKNTRQPRKLAIRSTALRKRFQLGLRKLAQHLHTIAEVRAREDAPTLLLTSIGSSGSHLFQNIIARCTPSIALGEVYIPPRLAGRVDELPGDQMRVFAEMYHLVHATEPEKTDAQSLIINTAHIATLEPFRRWIPSARAGIVLRSPTDIIVSRTFRKQEYRDHLHRSGVEDRDYLDENIAEVSRFFRDATGVQYDGYVDFDELRGRPSEAATRIRDLAALAASPDEVEGALRSAMSAGEETKHFAGKARPIPDELRSRLEARLRPIEDALAVVKSRHT